MLRTNNKYLRFIANGLVFIFLLFVIDQFAGRILRHYYFRVKSGSRYLLNYSMNYTEAEVLILGSSRACHHYVPMIIEDSLKLTCFNTGADGNFLLNSYAIFTSIIARHTPSLVILDLDQNGILAGAAGYDQLNRLLPYYKDKPEVRKIINLKSRSESIKLRSEIYPFNSSILGITGGNIKNIDIEKDKGYIPLFGKMNESTFYNLCEEVIEIDPNKIEALNTISEICEMRGIKLILLQSPRYAMVELNDCTIIIESIAKRYGAEFWNYVNDPHFMNPEYFIDPAHLNDHGAHEFSRIIASRIKQEMFTHPTGSSVLNLNY